MLQSCQGKTKWSSPSGMVENSMLCCVSAVLGVFMGFVGLGPSQISPISSSLCKRKERGVNESCLWLLCPSEAACDSEAAQDSCFENLALFCARWWSWLTQLCFPQTAAASNSYSMVRAGLIFLKGCWIIIKPRNLYCNKVSWFGATIKWILYFRDTWRVWRQVAMRQLESLVHKCQHLSL